MATDVCSTPLPAQTLASYFTTGPAPTRPAAANSYVVLILTRGREAVREATPIDPVAIACETWRDVNAPDIGLFRARNWIQTFFVCFDFPYRGVGLSITVTMLEVGHPKLEVLIRDILGRRCFRVIGKDVAVLNAFVYGRKGKVVAVERPTPLVIDCAVCREVRLRRILTTFQTGDSVFNGFDCPPNSFLNGVYGQVGFIAELVVEDTFGFRFGGNLVAVVAMPAPLTRGAGAVFELLDGLSEERVDSFGSAEFDNSGTTVFRYFHICITCYLHDRKSVCRRDVVCIIGCRLSPRPQESVLRTG